MDVAAKLNDAQIRRVAIVDDDLSLRITRGDLEIVDSSAAALLNDPMDPDREAYWELLGDQGHDPDSLEDPAELLADEAIRRVAPERLRTAAEAVLATRAQNAEPVKRVIEMLERLNIDAQSIDRYSTPDIPHDSFYDLLIVDYFLVDTETTETLPFIRKMLDTHEAQQQPLQVILMSSHDEQLRADFKTIRPKLKVSSSRVRIMGKPRSDAHVTAWTSTLFQLASDRGSVAIVEGFLRDTGNSLRKAAESTANKLWDMDLQAMDLLHEIAAKDHDDYTRYVEDAISRRLLSGLEEDGGMRPSLQQLDATLSTHRSAALLAPTAEIGDSRAAIHGLMHSMQWRAGTPVLPDFPVAASEIERSRWIRKHLRFGMVLRDPNAQDWLNITQACDLTQVKDEDISRSTVLFLRGQRTLPTRSPNGEYYVPLSAMMDTSDTHVLTWNLRDLRTDSIKDFSNVFGNGWQVVGELRPDVAQSIVAEYGARVTRVGLPRTLAAWRIGGIALRAGDLRDADPDSALIGITLEGHAIQRATGSKHELHLGQLSLQTLLDAHGDAFDKTILQLMTGLTIKLDAITELGGQPVIVYCGRQPMNSEEARTALKNSSWLQGAGNAERIVVFLWADS